MKFKLKLSILCTFICSAVLIGLFTNCAKMESAPAPIGSNPTTLSVTMSLAPVTSLTPNPIDVTVTVLYSAGAGTGLTITPTVSRATVGAVTDNGGGSYSFRVTPTITSGEVPITAAVAVAGLTAESSKIAVVLPIFDSAWGQPEAVPGYVNTLGYEDGPEVSQDGQWLLADLLDIN